MGHHAVSLRLFPTEAEAERYQAAAFADLLIAAADHADGTVEKTDGSKITRAALQTAKAVDAQLLQLVAETPLYGRKADGRLSRTDGISTRWAIVQPTADGQWAVAATPGDRDAVPESSVKFPTIDTLPTDTKAERNP